MCAKVRHIEQFKTVMEAVLSANAEILSMETNITYFVEVFNVLEEHDIQVMIMMM